MTYSMYANRNNCNKEIMQELRKNYDTPYFLPNDSESSTMDWIFAGVPGPGAVMHVGRILVYWTWIIESKKTQ